jgi:hypothetical protein
METISNTPLQASFPILKAKTMRKEKVISALESSPAKTTACILFKAPSKQPVPVIAYY